MSGLGAEARDPTPQDATPGTPPQVSDEHELLFWALMHCFEAQALARYQEHAPTLATEEKKRFVEVLSTLGQRNDLLAAHGLAAPTEVLLARADSGDETSTLIIQGTVLEHLRRSIYRIAASSDRVSHDSRTLAEAGCSASTSASAIASQRIVACLGTGEALFAVFAPQSHAVIGALDSIAEPVDRTLGERFGLRFAEVMGEFTADLIGACVELGMQRRKVVAHLTSACMGF